MANKDLKLNPTGLYFYYSEKDRKSMETNAWYYEMEDGIDIVVEHRDKNNVYLKTEQYLLPWRQIRAALKRKDK